MAYTPNTTPELAPFTFAYKVVHCAPIYLDVYPLSLPLLSEELKIVDRIAELIDENTYARICAYMIGNLIVFFVMLVLIKFCSCVNLYLHWTISLSYGLRIRFTCNIASFLKLTVCLFVLVIQILFDKISMPPETRESDPNLLLSGINAHHPQFDETPTGLPPCACASARTGFLSAAPRRGGTSCMG
jgi:hypothetical protein